MDKLVVVGQGYVGLPLAVRAAEVGFRVVGFDVDEFRVKRLASGESFAPDVTNERLTGSRRANDGQLSCIWLLVTVLASAYMVSRGLAKAGSYERGSELEVNRRS